MNSLIQYSIVLPCYKEAENLALLLPRLVNVLNSTNQSYEIIVVDTSEAMDDTAKIAAKNGVTYINRTPKNYYGDAVRTGIESATGKWLIFMDSDGSHPPEFLLKMFQHIDNNDLIIASRYMPGGETENSKLQVWVSKLLNKVYSFALNIKCHDISNSFRVYRTETIKKINLQCNNFDAVEEIIYKLIRMFPSLKIKEIPFTFKRRIHGTSKRVFVVFVASYLKTLVKLILMKNRQVTPTNEKSLERER